MKTHDFDADDFENLVELFQILSDFDSQVNRNAVIRTKMAFIGIDLAFNPNNGSGLSVIDENGEPLAQDYLFTDEEIAQYIERNAALANVIVIDAPLIVTNGVGQRPCEKLIGIRYGQNHASCHSTNLNSRSGAGQRGPGLVKALQSRFPVQICHDAVSVSESFWPVIETYPHLAHIELFDLSRIIRYKKGKVGDKKKGLGEYVTHLKNLSVATPALKWEENPLLNGETLVENLKGAAVKEYEDRLDGLFCAYTALYLWHHCQDGRKWKTFREEGQADFITIPILDTVNQNTHRLE